MYRRQFNLSYGEFLQEPYHQYALWKQVEAAKADRSKKEKARNDKR